jgi:hypothetical protein
MTTTHGPTRRLVDNLSEKRLGDVVRWQKNCDDNYSQLVQEWQLLLVTENSDGHFISEIETD